MKLSSVKYKSAIFLGAFSFLYYFVFGAIYLGYYAIKPSYMVSINALDALIISPITQGIIVYLSVLLAIFVYNRIAKKFPISWEVKK